MNSISGLSGFDPQAMMQKMQERAQQADTDGNGALSKTELTESMEEAGRTPPNFDKMFDKADTDGNGELSADEQQAMHDHMQQRMEQFQSMGMPGSAGFGYQQNSSFDSLLKSLETDDEQDNDLKSAIEQIQSGNSSGNQQAWQVLNESIPAVNTYA
ncbi:EF-hand domain-containing protein [Planctobacterium marinum]|uniref:EF-hand domain-containing protein n=1 Tax=Planctobacterium marinum TaxID=1631968 RepID=A0AA48HGQ1_9ALTE|nr:hypothetical protein MACH26_21290 [Planctobacterium marinum]